MNRTVKLILIVNLAIIAVLVFAFADLMVSPGRLIYDHRASETDCFACHTAFLGASSEKCIACHKVAEIGVVTTKGTPVVNKKTKVPFHQKLLDQDCIACHSDHLGVAKYRLNQKFSHRLVATSIREECVGCHQRPTDPIHRQISDKCSQCHGTDKWKPATFDHDKFFVLDRDHDVKCAACHTTADYKKYTCYECHEHSPGKIREAHEEEGIRDYENCIACHRSADEDEAKRAWESLKRGIPYQFGPPSTEKDKRRRKKPDEDDD